MNSTIADLPKLSVLTSAPQMLSVDDVAVAAVTLQNYINTSIADGEVGLVAYDWIDEIAIFNDTVLQILFAIDK